MGLIQKITRLFKSAPEAKPETLLAILVPKKTLADYTYNDERGLVNDECYAKYFDSCAADLEKAIEEIYKKPNTVTKKANNCDVSYTFLIEEPEKPDTKITYTAQGADRWESSSNEKWSSAIITTIGISAPTINLKTAGLLINKMLNTHLLEYRPDTKQQFGIFYDKNDENEPIGGMQLLKLLEIEPKEAAQLWQIMYFSGHNYVKLTQS